MSYLDINGLTKTYAEGGSAITAVEDLDIELDEGEFLVLVGPSGCGKSTTLLCVAGLEDPTDGTVSIGDRDVTDERPEARDIAMVFQNYALYPHMSARENMGFGLKMTTDLGSDEIDQRVGETADLLDITDLLDQRPKALSGGQQQRVALGRAIIREPSVFLMDEPLSNLDASLRSTMRAEIQRLQRTLDVTTVYVTHDQTEAMTMGDRIAVMRGGELQQLGTPLECYYEPANRFVAGFIGEPSMNFFDLERRDDRLIGDTIEYPLSDAHREAVADIDRVTLGIRPPDVEVTTEDGASVSRGTLKLVEPVGERDYLHLNIGGVKTTVGVDGHVRAGEGTTIGVRFPEDHIHLFDRATGEALVSAERSELDPTLSGLVTSS